MGGMGNEDKEEEEEGIFSVIQVMCRTEELVFCLRRFTCTCTNHLSCHRLA